MKFGMERMFFRGKKTWEIRCEKNPVYEVPLRTCVNQRNAEMGKYRLQKNVRSKTIYEGKTKIQREKKETTLPIGRWQGERHCEHPSRWDECRRHSVTIEAAVRKA